MPITHEQKADIGQKYLVAMKARIETREKAQKEALAYAEELDSKGTEIRAIALKLVEKYSMDSSDVVVAKLEEEYSGELQKRIHFLKIRLGNMISLTIPESMVPGLAKRREQCYKKKVLSRELCTEIEFLHDLIRSSRVAQFQANVARLWAPKSKAVVISATELKMLIEDFILSARPAVCKVA